MMDMLNKGTLDSDMSEYTVKRDEGTRAPLLFVSPNYDMAARFGAYVHPVVLLVETLGLLAKPRPRQRAKGVYEECRHTF